GGGRVGIERRAVVMAGAGHQDGDEGAEGQHHDGTDAPLPHRDTSCSTRSAAPRNRSFSSGPASAAPYQARSKRSVAAAKSASTAGTDTATSARYSPVVRPGISSTRPRPARSATRAR